MKQGNMEVLVEQVLNTLQKSGTSKKNLKDYKYCGLYPIRQYFSTRGIFAYSKTIADEFIFQVRSDYEQGKISRWKWSILRRSAELLGKYYTDGTVTLLPLPKWGVLHNPFRQEPSKQQLSEEDNLFVLVCRTKQELLKFGYKAKTISNYTYDGFNAILRYCTKRGITRYSKDVIDTFVSSAHANYESHIMCRSTYQNIRKAAAMLDEYHETGRLECRRIPDWGLRMPCMYYSEFLEAFCWESLQTGAISSGTAATARSAIRGFLFELEDIELVNFNDVELNVVSQCLTKMAVRYAGGITSMLFSVRSFLRFLYQHSVTSVDLSIAIPQMVAPRRVVREGFCREEMNSLLLSAESNASIGKRDYAIMMAAIQTGLRAVDIVNLKRKDIDWRSNQLRISQHKTGRPLSLPLEAETGNAIADYLLNVRPKCDLPFIFLCANRPYRPLKSRSASAMISRYMRRIGIDKSTILRRGFHSFRRSFGGSLLDSEISFDMLSELLGHAHMDSAKPYLAANEVGLKNCAIGLVSYREAGELR